jgi:hypothetical protein
MLENRQEMNVEWEAWQNVVREFAGIGIDINESSTDTLIKAINCWGELLVDLRVHQSPVVREDARTNRIIQYLQAVDESEED